MFSFPSNDVANREACWYKPTTGSIKACVISLCSFQASSSFWFSGRWALQNLKVISAGRALQARRTHLLPDLEETTSRIVLNA